MWLQHWLEILAKQIQLRIGDGQIEKFAEILLGNDPIGAFHLPGKKKYAVFACTEWMACLRAADIRQEVPQNLAKMQQLRSA